MQRRPLLLLGALTAVMPPLRAATTPAHPFLLVRREDFAVLQALALTEPGRGMRARALALAGGDGGAPGIQRLDFDPKALPSARGSMLADIFSTTALAWLLDPSGRPRHQQRILDHLRWFDPAVPGNLTVDLDRGEWARSTTQAGAFFQATLALDLIHDDIPAAQRDRIHAMLDTGIAPFYDEVRSWKPSGYAARGLWALYRGDRTTFERCKRDYLAHVLTTLGDDGVFCDGPGYAYARWTHSGREQKAAFGDVLAFTGEHPGWMTDARIQRFQEWLYGHASTPAGVQWAIGDSSPGVFLGAAGMSEYPQLPISGAHELTGFERAGRYSPLAARYAAHYTRGGPPATRLTSYLLMARDSAGPQTQPLVAPSRVYRDGAYFREASSSSDALAGVLHNPRKASGHAHKEVNSVHLAGYGQLLLRGSGYNGWATAAAGGFSWTYINRRAVSSNTLLIDYEPLHGGATLQTPSPVNDHRDSGGESTTGLPGGYDGKAGLGTEGFTHPQLDWATGEAGRALPNGRHRRDLVFIHPADGAPGYFVCLDLVQGDAGTRLANTAWHPNSATKPEVLAERQAYRWQVSPRSSAGLTIFLATEPASLDLYDGALASWQGGFVGKFLFTRYPLQPLAGRQIVTLLLPHDASHPAPKATRIAGGASVQAAAGVQDTALELDASTEQALPDGARVQAATVFTRRVGGRLRLLFLRDATRFTDPALSLSSSAPVTLVHGGGAARIHCATGTRLRLALPGLRDVRLNGIPLAASADAIDLVLPPGTHELDYPSSGNAT